MHSLSKVLFLLLLLCKYFICFHFCTIKLVKGGDDINQLCEANNEEFKEIVDLVGMSSKPLHIRRLKKAIDEYKLVTIKSTTTTPAAATLSNHGEIFYYLDNLNLK